MNDGCRGGIPTRAAEDSQQETMHTVTFDSEESWCNTAEKELNYKLNTIAEQILMKRS